MKFLSTPERQKKISDVMDLLSSLAHEEAVPYTLLRQITEVDPMTRAGRDICWTARQRLIATAGRKFECVDKSFRRLDDLGVIRVGEGDTEKMRKKATRSVRDLTQCVERYADLPLTQKQSYDVQVAVNGSFAYVTQRRRLKRVAAALTHNTDHQRAIVETLDAIRQIVAKNEENGAVKE
jgi:hypothetical protein